MSRRSLYATIMLVMLLAGCAPASIDGESQLSQTARVWFLGDNGWAVNIGDKMLIFDYIEGDDAPPLSASENRGLDHGYIDPQELSDFEVYVFVTHEHFDHYDRVIYRWADSCERITYIFGWQAGVDPDHHYMIGPRAQERVGDLEIFTINSHHSGVPEVAFLVNVDGITIYHNGDYKSDYEGDYTYLQTITNHIDIAFVIGWPYPEDQYFQQALLLAELFRPAYMFESYQSGNADKAEQFAEMLPDLGVEAIIRYAEHRGVSFSIPE
jgi:L-ascorbate metabolism protein UlaG (beta-lactamase superfamily)